MGDLGEDGGKSRDGVIDFSHYSDLQLAELRENLDAARFPRNYQNLVEEIRRREAGERTHRFPVQFTAADGLGGWFQAILARQPLYGSGAILIEPQEILVQGWQRTWLGFAHQSEIAIPVDTLRNAYSDDAWVVFESTRKLFWPKRYGFRAADPQAAAALVALLPGRKSKWFEKHTVDIQRFYRLQRSPGHRALITPLLVLFTLAIYLALIIKTRTLGGFDVVTLVSWGANSGILTVNGQWWRLITQLFLHLNLMHVLINMWVLWSAGRLAERLYGNLRFSVLYLVAGVMGGLVSIAWSPASVSLGASGAIFGILGAFLSYLVHGEIRVPVRVMRAHLIPTILFVIFSIFNGFFQIGIDNAAHVGGLITGLLLGWALARPFRRDEGQSQFWQGAGLSASLAAIAVMLVMQITSEGSQFSPAEEFIRAHDWYADGEKENLTLWQSLAVQSASGTIANADLAQQFENDVTPFWKMADVKLRREARTVPARQKPFFTALADFVNLRLRWSEAIAASARSNDSKAAIDLMQQTDVAQARLDQLAMRRDFDHMAPSIANSAAFVFLANRLWYDHRPCVLYPFLDFNPVAPTDSPTDGPATAHALGCEAQHLFLTRDFKTLEGMLNRAAVHLNDLSDGNSSFDAMITGLSNMLDYGGYGADQLFDRDAAWRRTVPGSVNADLMEAMILEAWAYTARGHGFADTVNNQNFQLFAHRTEMADAALQAVASRARNNPLWYFEALSVATSKSEDLDKRQQLFLQGRSRFPTDMAIYRSMLHGLMPRWLGSFEAVQTFIEQQARDAAVARTMPPAELYARLYWAYADLEGDQADIFQDAGAKWDTIKLGLATAMKRYPASDYLGNVMGRLACKQNDQPEYLAFHATMPKHYSASAWSPMVTVKICDATFLAWKPN